MTHNKELEDSIERRKKIKIKCGKCVGCGTIIWQMDYCPVCGKVVDINETENGEIEESVEL